jgi:hypothetical protein
MTKTNIFAIYRESFWGGTCYFARLPDVTELENTTRHDNSRIDTKAKETIIAFGANPNHVPISSGPRFPAPRDRTSERRGLKLTEATVCVNASGYRDHSTKSIFKALKAQ